MSKLGAEEYDFFNKDKKYKEKKTVRTDKKWIRCKEAIAKYSVSRPTIMDWAEKAGAVTRMKRTILIDSEAVDRYVEAHRIPEGVY